MAHLSYARPTPMLLIIILCHVRAIGLVLWHVEIVNGRKYIRFFYTLNIKNISFEIFNSKSGIISFHPLLKL